MMNKINVEGKIMWETCEGERFRNPNTANIPSEKRDKYGWHKINVDGKVMWESPEGERSY